MVTPKYLLRALFYAQLLLSCCLLASCAVRPLAPSAKEPAALQEIRKAYERSVREAKGQRHVTWRSGWLGNMLVNFDKENNTGLCYQWQARVYSAVAATAWRLNWDLTGVAINEGCYQEHHAVVVYDAARLNKTSLLEPLYARQAYVLDPWRRGEADVFLLSDWLDQPWFLCKPARLEVL